MRRVVRWLAAALAALLLVPGSASATTPFERPAFAERELVGKRTAVSRTWEMPSGRRVTQIAPGPVQWRDERGAWHEYDLALRTGGKGWVAQSGRVAIDLPAVLSRSEGGAVEVADGAGNSLSMRFLGAPAAGVATADEAVYRGVAKGVDIRLRPIPDGLKEDVVLNTRDASRDLRYRVTASGGLALEETRAGGLEAVRGKERVFVIPPPTLIDDAGVPGGGGRFVVRATGAGEWIVTTVLQEKWLDDPGRRWPVVVDPTISSFDVAQIDTCSRWHSSDGTVLPPEWDFWMDLCGGGLFPPTVSFVGKSDGTYPGSFNFMEWALRFDTALTLDPTDAIDSATLRLTRTGSSRAVPMSVLRITEPWGPYGSRRMTQMFPDRYTDPVPYAQIQPGADGPIEVDVTSMVHEWRLNQLDSARGFPNRGLAITQPLLLPTRRTTDTCATVECPWMQFSDMAATNPADRPVIKVMSWPAAAAGNAIISPGEGDLTGKRVPLQARALASSVRSVRFQYVAGSQRRWTDIPLRALSTPTRAAVSSVDIAVTGPSGDRESDLVVWDLSAMPGGEVDGPVHVRAWLESSIAGDGGMTDQVNFRLDRRGIDKAPTVEMGPGELNLLSGDFTLEQTDALVKAFLQDLTLTRTYRARGVAVRNADMFGSGWEASVEADGGELPYKGIYNYSEIRTEVVERQFLDPARWNWELFFETFEIEDLAADIETLQETESYNYEYLVVEAADGTKMTFTQVKDSRGVVTDWIADDLHPGFRLARAATGTSGIFEITLTDPSGGVATFRSEAANSPNYRLSSFQQPGSTSSLSFTYEASGTRQRLKRVTAPTPSGGVPRSLTFTWSNVGTPAVPRVTSVAFSDGYTTNPTVATYSYDSDARLIEVVDPRVGASARNVRYHYNAGGQLDQVTPSGEASWNLSYTRIDGDSGPRLASVSRAHPDGGTATRTIRYDVPLSGAGAPYDMSPGETEKWGQTDDLPWDAVAIWPEDTIPDERDPDYSKATVYYLGLQGLTVNIAEPGGAISTDWHDARGNVIRSLSPRGRAAALAAGRSSVAVAADRSTLFQYASNRVDIVATREPVTQITLADGRVVRGRRITTTHYDEEAPRGGPFHLPTRRLRAVETDSGDFDIRELVRYTYAGEGGMSGWTARNATKTVVDPRGKALTSYTILHGDYPIVEETRTPGSPGGGSNADVQWYQYYGMPTTRVPRGIIGGSENCGMWRGPLYPTGFLCLRSEATLPDAQIPRRWHDYTPLGEVVASWEVRPFSYYGAGVRYRTFTFDGAGQLTERTVDHGTGTAVPSTAFVYDAATGRQTQARSSVGTITRVFDSNGRLSSYTDASGTVTTYRYDLRGRRTSMTVDGATTSYGYDDRDNLTSVTDPAVRSAITATYDLDDQLASETLPNGLVMTQTWDETGRPALLSWTQTRDCSRDCAWVRSEVTNRDADGRIVGQRTNDTQETLAYDTAGRLVQSDAVRLSDNRCVRRTYEYDGGRGGDSNRTSASTWTSRPSDACGTGTPTTRTLTYDNADRISSSGWSWDYFGRATAAPATDSGGTGALSAGYYVNDMVRQLSLDGRTHTYTRDALDRTQRVDSSGARKPTLASTYRYSDDSDAPAKIIVSDSTTTRDIAGPSDDIVASDTNGTITYQLRDIQGSITAAAPTNGSLSASTEYDPFGIVTTSTPNVIDGTKGLPANGWLGAHQRPTQFGQEAVGAGGPIEMGVRVYLPTVGRFLQVDPVDGGSLNAYDYAFQDPTNALDLDGRMGVRCQNGKIYAGPRAPGAPKGCDRYDRQRRAIANRRLRTKEGVAQCRALSMALYATGIGGLFVKVTVKRALAIVAGDTVDKVLCEYR